MNCNIAGISFCRNVEQVAMDKLAEIAYRKRMVTALFPCSVFVCDTWISF